MRRVYILTFLYFFSITSAISQTTATDSLANVIATQADDTAKVNNLVSLSMLYMETDLQKMIEHGKQALTLAEKIDFEKGKGFAYKAIGLGNYFQGNYPEATVQFQHSLTSFEAISAKPSIANILSNLGATYFNAGEDSKAIDFYLRSLKISEEVNDKFRIGIALNNIGGVYASNEANHDKALQYYQRAVPIFEEVDYQDGLATATMNIGEIYFKKEKYDSAIHYFEKSLDIVEESIEAAPPLTYLAKIYTKRLNFRRAYDYHSRSIKIAETLDAKLELTQGLIGLAETQNEDGEYAESITTYKRAQAIAENIKARKELEEIYRGLTKSFAHMGDFKKAYEYGSLLTSVKDSLYNSDNDRKIQQLQFNFDIEKKEAEIDLLTKDQALKEATIQRQKVMNYAAGITGLLLLIMLIGFYRRHRYTTETNRIIKNERDRSKELLLNILPAETAHELETNGHAQTRYYDNITVMFADFKGFSFIARSLKPQELVAELNEYFVAFDEIIEKYNLEKIKTIGDAYMCAGGIPTPNDTHALNAVQAGLAMQEFMAKRKDERIIKGLDNWELRIGVHMGPIVAGVVGKKKYAYDIWGDTVNIASRMESSSLPGRVNISSSIYNVVKDHYECEYRGKIFAKNIGDVDMYFVGSSK